MISIKLGPMKQLAKHLPDGDVYDNELRNEHRFIQSGTATTCKQERVVNPDEGLQMKL